MDFLFTPMTRATTAIDRIFNCVFYLASRMFTFTNGYFEQLISTIMGSPLLLVCVSLMICGFVLGILKRLISL